MAKPSLYQDRRFSSPYVTPITDLEHEPRLSQWRPTDCPNSRFRSASEGLVLPRISSLLNSSQDDKKRQLPQPFEVMGESRKRKLPLQLESHQTLQSFGPNAKPRAPIVMYMPQNDEELRARRLSQSARHWDLHTPPLQNDDFPSGSSARRRAVDREFSSVRDEEEEMASYTRKPTDIPTCYQRDPLLTGGKRRRLYFQHSVDPHKIHEIFVPLVPPFEEAQTGKHVRYYEPNTRSIYYDAVQEEEELLAQKRRRVVSAPTPPSQPRQPLYEAEYGLAVLETSKPLTRSRYTPTVEITGGNKSAARRRYNRADLNHSNDFEKVRSSATAAQRIDFCGDGSVDRFRPPVSSSPPLAPVPLVQIIAENNEPSPSATLVLKSKEFLQSKNLVRNRHDEIDWVATFLKVGFDASSIYALMCPLRKGRWKSEEESYTMGLLKLIENGTILLRHGQSIRGYVGEKLHSDDMRVLKKLSNCKMFHFAKLINPRLSEEEKLDTKMTGAKEGLEHLDQLKGEFLRSVQLEALVAVRKYLSDSSLRDLLNVRA